VAKVWAAGWLSLSAAWLFHEILTFGFLHGYLIGERQLGFGIYPASLGGIILEALFFCAVGSVLFAVLAFALKSSDARLPILGAVWLALCGWAFMETAVGYRSDFGATWRWHEPFWALMWSPWLTPLATLLGLLPFLWAVRRS
jgi:hypothetical protein